MNTTPEEFQRRLKQSQRQSCYMLLFVLVQVGMFIVFCAVCRSRLPAFIFYFTASMLALCAALNICLYVHSLRFLKVYSRCVALIVRFYETPHAQVHLRVCLQEQLDAEVDKLSAIVGSARTDESTPS